MNTLWEKLASHTNILILGFGKEGQSTYAFIRSRDKNKKLTIADKDVSILNHPALAGDENLFVIIGHEYLASIADYDCVIKAPGISLPKELLVKHKEILTSQADLFLRVFAKQTIGITGTKGKSTVSSFTHYMLKTAEKKTVLLGNIGTPPFDMLAEISPETVVVFELSSHMLQTVTVSPHIAILLNIFPEHLDYYGTMENYIEAKAGIFKFQNETDILITDAHDEVIEQALKTHGSKAQRITWGTEPTDTIAYVPREDTDGKLYIQSGRHEIPFYAVPDKIHITGAHVLRGLLLGAVAACYSFADAKHASEALKTFSGLSHRLQTVGQWKGITFVDDSISTIPEAAIAALNAFPETSVLILGGMDRGISYTSLVDEIKKHRNLYVLCLDQTGKRIHGLLSLEDAEGENRYVLAGTLEEAVFLSYKILADAGGTVMLSPAAASYTQFKNFEERGKAFHHYAEKYGKQTDGKI